MKEHYASLQTLLNLSKMIVLIPTSKLQIFENEKEIKVTCIRTKQYKMQSTCIACHQEYEIFIYFGVIAVGLEDPMILLDDDDTPVVEHSTNNCPKDGV